MRRRSLLAVLASGTAGCAVGPNPRVRRTPAEAFEPHAPWPMDGGAATRVGHNPDSAAPRAGPATAWQYTVPGDTAWTTAPVTDERRVYLASTADEARVTALDARTGKRRWDTPLGRAGERVAGVATTGDALVAATTLDGAAGGRLVALDVADGAVRWRAPLPGPVAGSPTVADGAVYTATRSTDGAVYAHAPDGTRRWRQPVDREPETAASVADGAVVVGTTDGLVALDAADGAVRWNGSAVAGDACCPDVQGTPAIADGTVYVPGIDEALYAVSAADGSVEWTAPLVEDHGNAVPSPAVADGTVYVNTIHGGAIALDAADGTERWRTGAYGASLPPAVADGVVVYPRVGGEVTACGTDGESLWTFEMDVPDAPGFAAYVMDPEVAVAHDRAYVTVHDGRAYALADRG